MNLMLTGGKQFAPMTLSQSHRWIAAASFGFLAVAMAFFPGGSAQAQAQTVDICERTPQVETAILTELGLADDNNACMTVSAADLGGITALTPASTDITDLDVDDFIGLDGLTSLDLTGNDDLTTLPPGVLDPVLDTLETLALDSQLQGEISFAETDSIANTTARISVMRTQPYTTVMVSVAVSGDLADLFTVSPVTIPAGTTQAVIDVGVVPASESVTLTLTSPALVPSNANIRDAVVQVADPPGNTHVLTGGSPTATIKAFTDEFGGAEVSGDPIPIAEGSSLFARFMLSRSIVSGERLVQNISVHLPDREILSTFTDLCLGECSNINFGSSEEVLEQPGEQTARVEVRAEEDSIVEGPERFQVRFDHAFSVNNSGGGLHVTPPGRVTDFSFLTFEIQDNDTATATVAVTGTAQEGGAMPTAAVTLSAPLAADAVFTLALQASVDNPATVNGADADVTFADGLPAAAVTVTAGDMTSDAVNIHVVNDNAPDYGKQFKVRITGIEAADESSDDEPSLRRDLNSLITRIASGDVAISDDDTANICDRTPRVETAILTALSLADDNVACTAVSAADLGGISTLNLASMGITDLDVNDFVGLNGLTGLDLSGNDGLVTLPPGVLDPVLDTLEALDLDPRLQGEISFVESDSVAVSNTTATISVMRTQPYTAVTVSVAVTGDRADLFTVPAITIPAGTTQAAIDVGLGLDAIRKVVTLTLMPSALVPFNTDVVGEVVRVADAPGNTHVLTGSSPTATFKAFTEEFGGTEVSGDPPGDPIPMAEGSTLFIRFTLSRPLAGSEFLVQTWDAVSIDQSISAIPADQRFAFFASDETFGTVGVITENAPTQTVGGFRLKIIDDGIVEGPERFRIDFVTVFQPNFTNRGGPLHITPPGRVRRSSFLTFEIQDNDTATATVIVTGAVQEGGAMTTAAVTLSAPLAANAVFTLALQAGADNPAAISGADADVTFAGGLTTAAATVSAGSRVSNAVNIHVVNDDVPDDGKQFRVEITRIEIANEIERPFRRDLDSLITRVASGDVAIADDDSLRLSATAATNLDESGDVAVTLTLSENAPAGETVISYRVVEDSDSADPVESADFGPVAIRTTADEMTGSSNVVTVQADGGDTLAFFINVSDDNRVEFTESGIVSIVRIEYADGSSLTATANSTALFTITDNDLLTVGFVNEGIYRIPEDMPTSLTLSVSGADTTDFQDVTVTVRDTPEVMSMISGDQDEAILNEDYAALNSGVIIPAGDYTAETIINVPVTIVDDNLTEFEEVFTAELSTSTNSPGVMLASTTIATILIIDDDQLTVEFSTTAYSITEGDARNLMLSVSGGNTSHSVTVRILSSDGSAAAGDDYAAVTLPFFLIPINDYTTEVFINVPVTTLEDDLIEGDETFTVTLNHGHSLTTPGNNTVATVTITDDDFSSSSAALTASDPDAGEFNNEPGAVTLALMPGAPGASATVNFILSTATGTATLGEAADYTLAITHSPGVVVTPDPFSAAGGSFQLPGGVTEAVFTVTPVADAVADDGETVVIRVTGVDFSAGPNITVPTTERTVTIADYGTLPAATLAGTDATLGEGETHVSTLTFTDAPSRSTATVFLHADGSDAGVDAADYTLTVAYAGSGNPELTGAGTVDAPYSFTLPAGVSEATIRVFLVDDSLAEAQETLRLTLLRVEFSDLGDGTDIALSDQIGITITESVARLVAELATAGTPTEENLTTGTFTLQLSDAPTVSTASFNYAFTGGIIRTNFDATWKINDGATTDISNSAGSVTVPGSAFSGNPGEADVVFTITPRDDRNSVNEQITLTISNLVHGTTAINNIINNPAHLRITDDDDSIRLRIRTFLEGALQ